VKDGGTIFRCRGWKMSAEGEKGAYVRLPIRSLWMQKPVSLCSCALAGWTEQLLDEGGKRHFGAGR
jgi:hypothetical protein